MRRTLLLLVAGCAAPPPPLPAHGEIAGVELTADRRWTAYDFLPYAYVVDADGIADPSRPLFSEFVFTAPEPELPSIKADWLSALDATFDALTALDELGRRTDRTFDAWVGLPYPSREQTSWGDGLDFRRREDRQTAVEDFTARVESRWGLLQRVRLAGFAWTAPAMWETTGTRHWDTELDENDEYNTDEELVLRARDPLRRRGLKLMWIAKDQFYVFEGGGPHQHLSPWVTHNASGQALFDEVFVSGKPDSLAEHARLRGVGIVYDSKLSDERRLDSARAIFRDVDVEVIDRRRESRPPPP